MSFGNFIKKLFPEKHEKKKEVHSSFANFLRDYFTFHKQDKNGIVAILILILLFTAATFSYRLRVSRATPDTSAFQKQLDEFLASAQAEQDEDSLKKILNNEISSPAKLPAQLFVFNPNSATEEDFIKLGFTKKQATGILNYRNKGGKFRKKEDFAKIYTVSKEMYERLEAFIVIPEEKKKENFYPEKKPYEPKQKEKILIEINTADSLQLIKVSGIGSYTAMKIIELRQKLGGFYSKEQLREVYRVDSVRYSEIEPFILVDPFEVKKININTATLDELKAHPYIRYNIANSIVSIRQQHGRFNNIEGIKKSHLVTEDVFRKIAPYLTVD